ncbi:MAG: hypothetical protein HYV39_03415 [Candidatus Levybacteria bacterium]|nr:hypothetical protein [Candidatus Levybacteria bacterium]
MKKTIWNAQIPTLLGIVIILVGIAATSFLTKKGVPFVGKASLLETPNEIRITNITDASFTVSYITAGQFLGSIAYGTTEKTENIAIDQVDEKTQTVVPRNIHTIMVENLSPSTKYFFTIISGETIFLDNGQPFTVTTGPQLKETSSKTMEIKGTVISEETAENQPIVYVTAPNAQTLSTQVNKDLSYRLSLSNMRTQDLSSYISLSPNTVLTMLIVGSTQQSNATLFASQINPVPGIILSKRYDFTLNTMPQATSSAMIGFPSFIASPSALKTPQIINPAKNESFTDQKPQFRGTASPSAEVEIEIHSDEQIKTKIVAGKNGTWTFRPQEPLSEGEHTITIKTRDQFGILKIITQTFTVYAEGSQVGQSATPSATLTPTKAAATPTPTPTSTPTITATPSPTPTLIPLPPIPPPGTSSLLPLTIAALGTIASGFLVLRFLRGGTA